MNDHAIAASKGCPQLYFGGFWQVDGKIVHMFTNTEGTKEVYVSNARIVPKPSDSTFVPCQ